jgi:hypothetical protein
MFEIVKKVIESKIYELSAILKKIDTVWVQGNLSDEERKELISLARKNAEAQQSVDVLAKLEELDKRVKALEEERVNVPTTEEVEPYTVGKWYYTGDKVSFEGSVYECTAPVGYPCTWSPSEYPAYWQNVNVATVSEEE